VPELWTLDGITRTTNMILECKHCEAVVNVEELFSYDDRYQHDPPAKWTLGKCPSCRFPMLAVQEDYGTGWEESATRVYPPQAKQLGRSIPAPIRQAYREAVLCFKTKAFTASAIMCRKTLEGLCVEHGVKARNLSQSLKELKERGLIEGRLLEWAEALRNFGNEAAHDVGVTIAAQDAKDIIEFTEALIEYVFTYRDQFESFQKRRKANEAVKKKDTNAI
jgi:hypothetical protein